MDTGHPMQKLAGRFPKGATFSDMLEITLADGRTLRGVVSKTPSGGHEIDMGKEKVPFKRADIVAGRIAAKLKGTPRYAQADTIEDAADAVTGDAQ